MHDPLNPNARFEYEYSTGLLYAVEVWDSYHRRWKRIECSTPPTAVFLEPPDRTAGKAMTAAVVTELKPALPPQDSTALTELDVLADIITAETVADLIDALVGTVLRAAVASLFQGIGMAAVAPIIKLVADLLDESSGNKPGEIPVKLSLASRVASADTPDLAATHKQPAQPAQSPATPAGPEISPTARRSLARQGPRIVRALEKPADPTTGLNPSL
jgi:hypothetical protein